MTYVVGNRDFEDHLPEVFPPPGVYAVREVQKSPNSLDIWKIFGIIALCLLIVYVSWVAFLKDCLQVAKLKRGREFIERYVGRTPRHPDAAPAMG
ncbi:movement protein [Nomiamastrel virus]